MEIPKEAMSAEVAKRVCLIHGHRLGSLTIKILNPDPPKKDSFVHQTIVDKDTPIMCLACGLTLAEIRGEK